LGYAIAQLETSISKKSEMKKIITLLVLLLLSGCQKEKITFAEKVSDVFYLENAGASMRVLVEGNTTGKEFIIFIHGGPGVSSYFYDTKYINSHLGNQFATVYWDQRNAGASQGNNNGGNLTLDQMVDDLKKVIEVLKYRYGFDINVFLVAHSFGGLLAADFVTRPDCQSMIKGLIYVDGSHNYPLNDTLTREMLLKVGQQQTLQNRNSKYWEPIISYCNAHTGNFSLEESQQLEKYSAEAEAYIDSIKKVSVFYLLTKYAIPDKLPLSSLLVNLIYSDDSDFNIELSKTQFSSLLPNVTIPVLFLWGKYDFTCPIQLGLDFYNRIGSVEKSFAISNQSGHNMILQDKEFFCDEVNLFILKNR
jgi:pimeloyl-ACP methyl ester carboxylesterase